ncbi:MAG: DUF4252 domain-containing protein [Bacteroidales bacterium]|nr:DUF4252 domain-containing protein [Bacteroidales bacterium]
MKSRSFLILVIPAFLLFVLALWGCSNSQLQRTLKYYGEKPGFELKIIDNDSIKNGSQDGLSKLTRYLTGVKKVYILKFDSAAGNPSENQQLYQKIQEYLKRQSFADVFSLEGRKHIGIYLKKDKSGSIEQTLFLKWGGRYSLYIWAPSDTDQKK